MPNRDGTGPRFSYRFTGVGRGPCGQGGARARTSFRGRWSGPLGEDAPAEPVEPAVTPLQAGEAVNPPGSRFRSPWVVLDERLARLEDQMAELAGIVRTVASRSSQGNDPEKV
jgi:hypothetical protein